mmetsp:Transcript_14232/g.26698  ORF Transcript_14232/g.26698 Transcript_14232/m.26698 type:complete len:404 (+) Transcript_14232:951-2162(+)|eukprot:CAMPEP_0176501208 /NCGR_PEP_ID=MMETSP0200_2-20121128/14030_1 /TAXON_ID=947934 /ORGANISM="Chaetoceros sp., Strain GSL56" /LENGTH=403 /DNA_ID=CAMNT_0017900063 /DNA_START=891 /DNA_END=2105 /DNA_ORIENTATION=+
MSAEPVARKSILSLNAKSPSRGNDIEGGQPLYNVSSTNSFSPEGSDTHQNNPSFSDHADDISNTQSKPTMTEAPTKPGALTSMGLKVLALLAFQNAFKNILMRFVMKDHGGFLLSTAVIVVEVLKLFFSTCYIVFYQKQSAFSIVTFIRSDWKNTLLLIVPATSYSLQMSLEYIAMANIDPASFSVLVQMKMLTTAMFFRTIMKKQLMKKQFISLVILTVGVMLCSMKTSNDESKEDSIGDKALGIAATLGIACSSGFASVYTEKVIKTSRKNTSNIVNKQGDYGLAHMQAQLAIVSLVILGAYALIQDFNDIMTKGFFYNYNAAAAFSSLNSAVGGLIVAAVLKYADSVLKGYATAISVVLTGVSSHLLFGTNLTLFYGMGIVNVIVAVLLYNSSGLDEFMC